MTLEIRLQPGLARPYDRFEVIAEGLGRYVIEVSLPTEAATQSGRFPAVLVTDGNLMFDIAQTVVHGRHPTSAPLLPPSIVVGVGYPDDEGRASWFSRRHLDFYDDWDMTDPAGQLTIQMYDGLKKSEGVAGSALRAGGYRRFMAFLRDALLPALTQHYPIDPDGRHSLVGVSSGGWFALRALFDPSSPFSRYVSISAPFGFATPALIRAEAKHRATRREVDTDLYICCGREEVSDEGLYALAKYAEGIQWAEAAFKDWPNARVQGEIWENEDHMSMPPHGIASGLRSVHRLRPGVHRDELHRAMAPMAAEVGLDDY